MRLKHMTKGLLLSLVFMSVACMPQQKPVSQEQTFEDVSFLTDEDELKQQIEQQDKELAEKLKKMDESDDGILDVENLKDEENPNNKVLVAGDSWAVLPCMHGSLKKAFKQVKARIGVDDRCLRTSKLGMMADEWLKSKQNKRIKEYLTKNANIKYLYLSLGGNDVMKKWTKTANAQEEYKIANDILVAMKTAIASYLVIRPALKVIVSGYDFPHFQQKGIVKLYRGIYKKMGEPTDLEINSALVRFTQHISTVADFKNIYYINHIGLAQYYDGVKDMLPPLATPSPDQISPFFDPARTGGDVNYPTGEKSMLDWLWMFRDCFHWNEKNYDRAMLHTYNNIFANITVN